MDSKMLAQKKPMALPGFTVITPKEETAYDKMIREKQEQMGCLGCGDHYFPRHDYKSRKTSSTEVVTNSSEQKNVTQTDQTNKKR
jgi:uncharacterized OB-fold protein